MKKIMKKALSLMLVLALAIVPMTAFAGDAIGSEANADPIESGSATINIGSGKTYYFYHMPADYGDYVITVSGQTGFKVGVYDSSNPDPSVYFDTNGTVEANITTSRSTISAISFMVMNTSVDSQQYSVQINSKSSGSGEDTGGAGTWDDPAKLTTLGTLNSPVVEGQYWYEWTATEAGTFSVSVSDEDYAAWKGAAVYTITDANGNSTYPDNPTSATHSVSVNAGDVLAIVLNAGQSDTTLSITTAFEPANNGAGTWDDPAKLTTLGALDSPVVEGQYWYEWTATEAGTFSVSVSDEDYAAWKGAAVYTITDANGNSTYPDNPTSATHSVSVNAGDVLAIVLNAGQSDTTLSITTAFEPTNGGAGTWDDPATLESLGMLNSPLVQGQYWYEWTATEAGTFSISISAEAYAAWKGAAIYTITDANGNVTYPDNPTSATHSVFVKKGDVLAIVLNAGQNDTSLFITTDFVNYKVSDTELVLKENSVVLDADYGNTLYEFTPQEVGNYKFETSNGVIGYWGTDAYINDITGDAKTNSVEVTISGGSIYVGVTGDASKDCTITVTRLGDATENTLPTTSYKNIITPSAFTFTGDTNALEYVDIEDNVIDKAVPGTDGYYHLNSADGPILFVNLDDQLRSLVDVAYNGQLTDIIYDENKVAVSKVEYNTALNEYSACMDAKTNLYPLTADLMEILQKVGADKEWYNAENQFSVGSGEDAWMFACYYQKGLNTLGTSTGVAGGAVQSPVMGDSTNVAVWAIVMVVATAAVVVTVETKKRAR